MGGLSKSSELGTFNLLIVGHAKESTHLKTLRKTEIYIYIYRFVETATRPGKASGFLHEQVNPPLICSSNTEAVVHEIVSMNRHCNNLVLSMF
jgi:hypothetical protein